VGRQQASADVVGRIYEAALEPATWPQALGRVAEEFGAQSAAAFVVDVNIAEVGFIVVSGLDPRALDDYVAHYAQLDPWNEYLRKRPSGQPIVSQTVMDDRTFERTEFCHDFLRRYGIFYAMGGFVVRTGALAFLCGVQRQRERGAFTAAELQRMRILFPHLERAVRIHRRLVQATGLRDGMTAALDRMPLGAILADRFGRAVWMNRAAEELVRQADGLRLRDGRIEATAGNGVSAELRRLIQGAVGLAGRRGAGAMRQDMPAANGHDLVQAADAGGMLQLLRPLPQRPLTVMVTPLAAPGRFADAAVDFDLARPTALLLISDPERAVQLPTDHLARTFGLTGAEAKLAAALATGTSLTDYADAARITIGTARWYLKQALAKMGAHRQSELVRHVISAVGAMGAGA
jgi:DNA-binding CsgD family transcriptional regulator/PAS domain-containing protein